MNLSNADWKSEGYFAPAWSMETPREPSERVLAHLESLHLGVDPGLILEACLRAIEACNADAWDLPIPSPLSGRERPAFEWVFSLGLGGFLEYQEREE